MAENWLADFTYMREHYDWGILTYTFHPHVIGRGHRMLILEQLIRDLRAGGAQFVTMEQAVAEFGCSIRRGAASAGDRWLYLPLVIPAKAEIRATGEIYGLDSRFRGNDG